MKKVFFCFAILAMISFISCTKEGLDGKDGINGAAGTNGTNGTNGNANVISSTVITLNNWYTTEDDGYNFTYTSTAIWSSLSQDIKDKGLVMVYMQSGSDYWALPLTQSDDAYSSGTYNFSVSVGYITIELTGFDDTGSLGDASLLNGYVNIRIVAIPSSVVTAHPNTNWKDYTEVNRLLIQSK